MHTRLQPRLNLLLVGLLCLSVPALGGEQSDYLIWEVPSQSPPSGITLPPSRAVAGDPIGDTFGVGVPQTDISQFSAEVEATLTDLLLELQFATSVSPGDSGQADALAGFLDLDIDQNPATGFGSWEDLFCPEPSGIGSDYFVDLGSFTTGQMSLVDETFTVAGLVDATFTSSSVSIVIPLALLGDDGLVDTATVIGTNPEPTDCAPNGTFLTSDVQVIPVIEIPAAGTWGLAILALLLLFGATTVLRRRAHFGRSPR